MSGIVSTIARRRKAALARAHTCGLAPRVSPAAMSARDTVGDIPNDYRKRHPIAIKEGDKTVEVFIGNNRGALTAGAARRRDWRSRNVWKQ